MGWGREAVEGEAMYRIMIIIHLVIWQKATQHCNIITLQLKK